MKSNILITGATGFVGANLTNRLVKENYNANILTRKNSNKWRLKPSYGKINEYMVDLTERDKLFDIIRDVKPEVIFHLATQGIHGGIQASDEDLINTNILGTKNLIDVCNDIDYMCFINTGSSSEYGLKNKSMKEDDVCSPINFYGLTKNASTQYAQMIAKIKDKPIINFRLFSPFGPLDSQERLIPTVIFKALQNQEIYLADPNISRDFIFIDDVVDLYIQAIEKADKSRGEIFNIGSGIQSKIFDVVDYVMDVTKSKSKLHWNNYKKRDYDNFNWIADMNKTKDSFNWEPKYTLERGLEKTIEWYKKNKN